MRETKKLLSVIALLAMLLSLLPISVLAESVQTTLPYNAEYFVNKGDRHSKLLKTNLYDGLKMPSSNKISIAGSEAIYDFLFDDAVFPINKNDVLEISDTDMSVALSNNPAKYIGIIANTFVNSAVNAEFKLIYDDETEKSVNASVNSMLTAGDYSYNYGKSLKVDSTTSALKRYNIEAENVYFNLIEIKTDSIKNVSSIKFGASEGSSYHIIGVVEIPYTPEELEEIKNQATTGLLPEYETKTLFDIKETDLENLSKLLGSLDPQHEKYMHIYNLYNGYILYNAQKELKENYDALMNVKDYLNESAENLDDTDEINLSALIELYIKQEKSDRTALENIMLYFSMNDDIFLNLNEKDIISAIKDDYLKLKDAKELLSKIENLYSQYDNKKTADLSDSDIEKINELISYYNMADEKEISYNAEQRAHIEKLAENYPKYLNSTADYYYDLSPYFNKGITAEAGASTIPDYWGATDRFTLNGTTSTYTTGIRKSVWDNAHFGDGTVVATKANFQRETSVITPDEGNLPTVGEFKFKISTESDITAKNVVELKDTSIVIPGSKKLAGSFNILTIAGTNQRPVTFKVTMNYTDGTSKEWSVGFPHSGWDEPAVIKLDDRTRPYIVNGEMVLSQNRVVSRAAVLPIEAGKIIDTVKITGASEKSTECLLLAVTEEMISNEKYEQLLSEQFNVIKDYTKENYDIKEIKKFFMLYDAANERGIDRYDIVTEDDVFNLINKIVILNCDFKRTDDNKVRILFNISMPNGEEKELLERITLALDKIELKEYVFDKEKMTVEAVLEKEKLENSECNLQISGINLKVDDNKEKEYSSASSYYKEVFVARENAIDKFIKASTSSEVAGYITSYDELLSIDSSLTSGLDLDDAGALFIKNKNLFDKSDITTTKNNISKLLILSAFNQGKKDMISKDGKLVFEDLMGYSQIDSEGVTIYSLYKSLISEEGCRKIVDSLLNKDYVSLDELFSDIAENIIIYAIKYPRVGGVGYVSDVLTTQNVAKISLSIPKYFSIYDKTSINTALAGAEITSKESIETVVNNFSFMVYPSVSGSSSSGGFSGGSAGSSNMGVDKSYYDELVSKNNESNGETVFKDVPKTHWAYEFINELYNKKIISGKADGEFLPEDGLTRAELVKIIVTAENLKSNGSELPFSDVISDSWYTPYIKAAYENGIITGVTENTFAPDGRISRQDLCVLLYRLINEKSECELSFIDSQNIAPYARDAVAYFVNYGIINGFEDGSFRPEEGCTRAQCAKIISMFINK